MPCRRVARLVLASAVAAAWPCVVLTAQDAPPAPASVRALLALANVPADGLPAADLAEVPLDFAVDAGAASTALVYRVAGPDTSPRLVVRVHDRATASWRTAAFDAPDLTQGVVQETIDLGDWLVLDMALDERAGVVLVLDRALALRDRIEGSLVGRLPGDALLVRENAEDDVPARPLALSLFAVGDRRHERIYPPSSPPGPTRRTHVDRVRRAYASWGLQRCLAAGHPCNADRFDAFVVSEVRADARGERFGWVTRFGPPDDASMGPVDFRAYVVVSCDRTATGATCREYAFGGYDGPEGPNTAGALASALVRRGERRD